MLFGVFLLLYLANANPWIEGKGLPKAPPRGYSNSASFQDALTSNISCDSIHSGLSYSTFPGGSAPGATQNMCRGRYPVAGLESANLKWVRELFAQPQTHPWEIKFYDPDLQRYTPTAWLNDNRERYGGVDSVTLWPTYPQLGVDWRNQLDMFTTMPGGPAGLKQLIRDMKTLDKDFTVMRGYNPWDTFTRAAVERGADACEQGANFNIEFTFDGVNLDGWKGTPPRCYATRNGSDTGPLTFATQTEQDADMGAADVTAMAWHEGLFDSGTTPGPYRPEGPGGPPLLDLMKYTLDARWTSLTQFRYGIEQDHLWIAQSAFFSGVGVATWENIWGAWNGLTDLCGEVQKRASAIQRYFSSLAMQNSEETVWEPYTKRVIGANIFASRFELAGSAVHFIVNRDSKTNVATIHGLEQAFVYDCYSGKQLNASARNVSVIVDLWGIGCVYDSAQPATGDLKQFFSVMQQLTKKPLRSFGNKWRPLQQKVVNETTPKRACCGTNMVKIPGKRDFKFVSKTLQNEQAAWSYMGPHGNVFVAAGTDVQFPWEIVPSASDHIATIEIAEFHIDKFPVTNADYVKYLAKFGYKSRGYVAGHGPDAWVQSGDTWVRHLDHSTYPPSIPRGKENQPVRYVGYREAKEYCNALGKRLPHTWEWLYAARGDGTSPYPWGSDTGRIPALANRSAVSDLPEPVDVDARPELQSSQFGIYDLMFNLNQYTTEFRDERQRSTIVKGGTAISAAAGPIGTSYYFPQANPIGLHPDRDKPITLDDHMKYFLMDNEFERAGTIGFRCASDAVLSHKCVDGNCWDAEWTLPPFVSESPIAVLECYRGPVGKVGFEPARCPPEIFI